MPQGGFGNLIALPLQKEPRDRGNSVFLDADLNPWPDQWAFLAGLHRLDREQIERTVQTAERQGRVLGVRLPPQEDDEREPWSLPPSRRPADATDRWRATEVDRAGARQPRSTSPRTACRPGCATGCCGSRRSRILSSTRPRRCGFRPTARRASSPAPRTSRIHIGTAERLPRRRASDARRIWESLRRFVTSAAAAGRSRRPSTGICGLSSRWPRTPCWHTIPAYWRPRPRSARQ